ncbi:MAG UNVERIFIED_CONTAM: pyridoxine 5'-phosphate synthase [Planctomycetaceae bacterium]
MELLRATVRTRLRPGNGRHLRHGSDRLAPSPRHGHPRAGAGDVRTATTEGGLDVASQVGRLGAIVERLQGAGIGVSLFVDAQQNSNT